MEASKHPWSFGPFKLDPQERVLWQGDARVPLTPKATDLLIALVANAGRVMEKDELLRTVWPGAFVEEGVLAVNVTAVRQALSRGDDNVQYIETLPRRGYRFAASHLRQPAALGSQLVRRLALTSAPLALMAATLLYWDRSHSMPPSETYRLTPLSVDAETETWPAISPDGRLLAFLHGHARQYDLVVRSLVEEAPPRAVARGLSLQRITWNSRSNRVCFPRDNGFHCVGAAGGEEELILPGVTSAEFLPEDRGLIYLNDVNGHQRIVESAPPGARPRVLPGRSLPAGATVWISRLSSDGKRLVASDPATLRSWVVSLQDGTANLLPVQTRNANWSRDGATILAADNGPAAGGALVSLNIRTGARIQLLRGSAIVFSASASDDHRVVVYATGNADWNLLEGPLTGGPAVRRVASTEQEVAPQFSPDGQSLLHLSSASGDFSVYVRAPDGRNPRRLADLGLRNHARPRYSPNSQLVVFADTEGLALIPSAGGPTVRLVESHDFISSMAWSSDGRWVFYASAGSIWRVPSHGGKPQRIHRGHFVIDASPDGRWLAFSPTMGRHLYATLGDVMLLDLRESAAGAHPETLASGVPLAGQFASGGRKYYSINPDQRSLGVWDVSLRQRRGSIELSLAPGDAVFDFSIDRTERKVLMMAGGHRLDLWRLEARRPTSSAEQALSVARR